MTSLSLNGPAVRHAQQDRQTYQLNEAKRRVEEAAAEEFAVQNKQDKLPPRGESDWTEAYKYWDGWADLDDISEKRKTEQSKLEEIMSRPDFMGHYHDHSEERKFFEKAESEKMDFCERHRCIGNYLYTEGMLPKAAEQYQIALSYYEYCFPGKIEDQKYLDDLRHACLCNISSCFYRMGYFRKAIESASHVICEDHANVKAYYRRAVAYRALDEYSNAEKDLNRAQELNPQDSAIIKEKKALLNQRSRSITAEHEMAGKMLSNTVAKVVTEKVDSYASECIYQKPSLQDNCTSYFAVFSSEKPLEPILPTRCFVDLPTDLTLTL